MKFFPLLLVIFLIVFYLLLSANPALASSHLPSPSPYCDPKTTKLGQCPPGLDEIEQVIANVFSVSVGLSFIALLVMLVVAGFKYITSAGDQKALTSAHHTAAWTILGLLFLAIAWIVLLLISAFTGIDLKVFDIRQLCLPKPGGGNWCTP